MSKEHLGLQEMAVFLRVGGSFFGPEGPSIHSKQNDGRGDGELRAT